MDPTDLALLLIRATVGLTMVAHGWNHAFGAGGIAGTTGWFASMGMRPAKLHATLASVTEVGAGLALALGLLTPLVCAALVGTLAVAFVTAHLRNGFFIFRPGQGYEYILILITTLLTISLLGPGAWSLDAALDIAITGWLGLALAGGVGLVSAAALLAVAWRPSTVVSED